MAIIKWEPFGDVDRFFEEFPAISFPKMGLDLAVDVYEDENNIIAEMNLPGIEPEKVDVTVEDNYLRVRGSREEKKEEKKKHYYSKEIRRGSFERAVRLPNLVQKDKVKAEYKDGILKITLPKAAGEKAKKIQIKAQK